MITARFKLLVGALFMAGHLGGIIVIASQFRRFENATDMATHILILGSFTTFLAVAFFRYLFLLLPGDHPDLTTTVNPTGAYPILLICLAAAIGLIAVILYFTERVDFAAADLRIGMTAYESVLGVFLGFAGEALFGAKRVEPAAQPPAAGGGNRPAGV